MAKTVREVATTHEELGGVATYEDYVYYAAHDRNQVRRVHVESTDDTLIAEVPEPWALFIENEHIYVSSRPDYCAGGEGEVLRIPVDGGNAVTLESNLPRDAPTSAVTRTRARSGPGPRLSTVLHRAFICNPPARKSRSFRRALGSRAAHRDALSTQPDLQKSTSP
jgi:hypothetical protein